MLTKRRKEHLLPHEWPIACFTSSQIPPAGNSNSQALYAGVGAKTSSSFRVRAFVCFASQKLHSSLSSLWPPAANHWTRRRLGCRGMEVVAPGCDVPGAAEDPAFDPSGWALDLQLHRRGRGNASAYVLALPLPSVPAIGHCSAKCINSPHLKHLHQRHLLSAVPSPRRGRRSS